MNILEKVKQLSSSPGIYLFYSLDKELIYVGKATNLRSRVGSYFRLSRVSPQATRDLSQEKNEGKIKNISKRKDIGKKDSSPSTLRPLADRSGFGINLRPIEQMIHEVKDIKVKQTDSVLEAIILEGNYIKKYRPKYNVDWKDDKSWNYIVVTKDIYPQVQTLRSHEYRTLQQNNPAQGGSAFLRPGSSDVTRTELKTKVGGRTTRHKFLYVFGPYPGLKTRKMMRLLQKLFYISTCKPNSKRECLYHQMGQCLGVCTGEINSKEYKKKVIRPLATFLRGNKKGVIKNLEKEMKIASKEEYFEEAARLRNQIESLQRIQDIALLNNSFFGDATDRSRPVQTDFAVSRIEGYDISNLGTSGKVGSMVVFDELNPIKSQYRKFKIKSVEGQSDVDCLQEVLIRRFNHTEWFFPNVILIDGGKPQVNRTKKVLQELHINIPVVGIAKGPERKKNEFIFGSTQKDFVVWVNQNQQLLIRVRDEAHRFAITFQRSLRKISYK